MNDDLFAGVGKSAKVDHVAVEVAFGQLEKVAVLFEKLGYEVDPMRLAQGKWGMGMFMIKDDSITIQLIDANDTTPVAPGGNHLAIRVDDPLAAAVSIGMWLNTVVYKLPIFKHAAGGKIFVYLPSLLTMPIELVPAE